MPSAAGVMMVQAAVLGVLSSGACSASGPLAGESGPPRTADRAAPVPTLTITEALAGTPLAAEAGDHIAVRLPASPTGEGWRFTGQAGGSATFVGSHLETPPDDAEPQMPVHVFRFSTTAAGQLELRFAQGDRVLTFIIEIR